MSTALTGQVPVPADIDRPDNVLWGLNGRQVVLLAPVAIAALLVWQRLAGQVPPALLLGVTAPVLGVAVALALGRFDGLEADRMVMAAVRHPRRPLAAGQAAGTVLRSRAVGRRRSTAALTGPITGLDEDGLLHVGRSGVALGLHVGCLNFDLRSVEEQADLVVAFARTLHAVEAHCQLLLATRPVDLSRYVAATEAAANSAMHPRLAQVAASHAAWLAGLVRGQRLLERQVTVVVRAADVEAVERSAELILGFAEAVGIEAWQLDAAALAERVRAAVDPYGTPLRRSS